MFAFPHDLDFEVPLGQEPFQSGVLLLQLVQAVDVVGVHAIEALPSCVNCLVEPGDLGHRILVRLVQDADNLPFQKSSLSPGSLCVIRSHLLKFYMVRKDLDSSRMTAGRFLQNRNLIERNLKSFVFDYRKACPKCALAQSISSKIKFVVLDFFLIDHTNPR